MTKTTVGSRELKTRLGTYLREVQRGRIIIVTDRGRPVAELRRVASEGISEQARLEEMVALGLVTRKSNSPLARRKPFRMAGESLSTTILKSREDRL
jgi:prevent-host-death family protein